MGGLTYIVVGVEVSVFHFDYFDLGFGLLGWYVIINFGKFHFNFLWVLEFQEKSVFVFVFFDFSEFCGLEYAFYMCTI